MNQVNDTSFSRVSKERRTRQALRVASSAAIALAIGACSAAPDKGAEDTVTVGAADTASPSCVSVPFSADPQCSLDCDATGTNGDGSDSGGDAQSLHPETTGCMTNCTCTRVTSPPMGTLGGSDAGTAVTSVSLPATPVLASLGCKC